MPSNLARSISLTLRGHEVRVRTPLLVPSFSSKAVVDVDAIFEALRPSITESFLVSAYDVKYSNVKLPNSPLAEVLFLDSGGYEVSKDIEAMEPLYPVPIPKTWTTEKYRGVLEDVDPILPTFVTAFDHPALKRTIPQQIHAAIEIFKDFPKLGREILFKPECESQHSVPIPMLSSQVSNFAEFDIVGVTETELGGTFLERMANIARIRSAMASQKITKPIHIFGSLDPVSTPLYFLAGADIFDGLSWLRFAYKNDLAVYHKNHSPLQFGITDPDRLSLARSYDANLHYLADLERRMKRYLLDRNEKQLGIHGDFFARSVEDLRFELGGII